MFNFDYITKEDTKEQNPNWPGIPEYQCRILIVGCSRSEKTNALLNINHEPDNDEIYLYSKDPHEQNISCYLTKKSTGLKNFNDSETFIEYWMIWMIIMKILKNAIQVGNRKSWLYLMIWYLICLLINSFNSVIGELYIRGRKLNISLVFITRSSFAVSRNIRINSRHYFCYENSNQKRTLTNSIWSFIWYWLLKLYELL